jgi:hypothetical protein
MLAVILTLLRSLLTGCQSHSRLALENLALRHQLTVLQRQTRKPKLRPYGAVSQAQRQRTLRCHYLRMTFQDPTRFLACAKLISILRENHDREDRIVEKSVGSINTGLMLAVCDLLGRLL